ncbi:conserved hypothetical protein [Ricinus communis]|uniref:Uncharacterized protein n=1 Tax=Ricinus communis TaxID=3988 RepID=B9SEU4_RICCO|nr:conserved hypothetical protein [Ricinus communis]
MQEKINFSEARQLLSSETSFVSHHHGRSHPPNFEIKVISDATTNARAQNGSVGSLAFHPEGLAIDCSGKLYPSILSPLTLEALALKMSALKATPRHLLIQPLVVYPPPRLSVLSLMIFSY